MRPAMNFTRKALHCDACNPDPVTLCAGLASGRWAIEAEYNPPPAHDPARLPLGDRLTGAFALSLSSRTAIGMSLGPALVDRLMALGPAPGPLVGLALHELIVNAIIHGNLHVASGRSHLWQDVAERQALIAASLADRSCAERVVTIAIGWRPDRVVAVVADEGDGYDPATTPTPGLAAGRGLRLARMAGQVDVRCGGRQTAITIDYAPAARIGHP
jgi:hypothetical protein